MNSSLLVLVTNGADMVTPRPARKVPTTIRFAVKRGKVSVEIQQVKSFQRTFSNTPVNHIVVVLTASRTICLPRPLDGLANAQCLKHDHTAIHVNGLSRDVGGFG